jgi:hypothetical protein
VLGMLGKLTTTLGVGAEARKWDRRNKELRDPTIEENRWIEAAVLALIRRVGQMAFNPAAEWPMIKKSDLPKL